ncbi:MAG: hypothetical protein ACFFAO_15820 [Candidatus Hermodarchaeota archaeon]
MEKNEINKLRCKRCGNIIETIPVQCGYSINLNEDSGEWECYMGPKHGMMRLSEMICLKCLELECYP